MSETPVLTPVREAHRFDEAALAAYLTRQLGRDFSDMQVEQFEGGQSNPTFMVASGDKKYVVRKKPPGELLKSAHAVDREYRVMNALRDTDVPVPKTIALCEDESVIGTYFFVMEHVEGRVFPDQLVPSLSADERRALYDNYLTVLAALHKVDYRAIGLEDYGKPGSYFERQISRWSKQYVASKTDEIPSMDHLMQWLPANIPQSDESSIAHGDYRIGNCIMHPTEPRIVAVLDWELSTIGHPLADLSYCCMMYHLDEFRSRGFPEGVPTEEQFVARYCELAGRPPIENWPVYVVFSLFRYAAIGFGVYKRGLDGNASSEHWKNFKKMSTRIADTAWDLARQ